ncbi:hypothetical protein [Arthrobacter sp. Soil762]|uniref:hypothetical protein n=1 Tax=Arthrobacter sp. Soil762 TaxID=1736401 RepID=UPI00070058F4|nr:hypothetical protein [Arthrobacter sp. Soil762]KRE71738.1 hypothetical protein ASG77_12045 [Arthrobacter sp. Soil762]
MTTKRTSLKTQRTARTIGEQLVTWRKLLGLTAEQLNGSKRRRGSLAGARDAHCPGFAPVGADHQGIVPAPHKETTPVIASGLALAVAMALLGLTGRKRP